MADTFKRGDIVMFDTCSSSDNIGVVESLASPMGYYMVRRPGFRHPTFINSLYNMRRVDTRRVHVTDAVLALRRELVGK